MKCFGLLMFGITMNAALTNAKGYTKCELARELYYNGIPKTFISNSESGGYSNKVTEFPNLSSSYGVFQINSKEWCRKGRKGGECGIRCEEFLNEDIKDDIKCAKVIYNRHGFKYWKGWQNRCQARVLPDVSKCTFG